MSKDSSSHHAGHRGRLRAKYKKNGVDSLEFHEVLELLLFYPIPRRDTNITAHELAKRFNGSIAEIFEASDKTLKDIPGISDQTILFFRLLIDIKRLYNIEIANKSNERTDRKFYENYLIAHFTGRKVEEVVLITLNNKFEKISCDVICTGSVNASKVDLQKMVRTALEYNASGVIVAHNHPNGPDYPSPEDLDITRRMERLFSEISIHFVDHYVVSDTKISSIKEQAVYKYR